MLTTSVYISGIVMWLLEILIAVIKEPESWWIIKYITTSNQSKVNPQGPKLEIILEVFVITKCNILIFRISRSMSMTDISQRLFS